MPKFQFGTVFPQTCGHRDFLRSTDHRVFGPYPQCSCGHQQIQVILAIYFLNLVHSLVPGVRAEANSE